MHIRNGFIRHFGGGWLSTHAIEQMFTSPIPRGDKYVFVVVAKMMGETGDACVVMSPDYDTLEQAQCELDAMMEERQSVTVRI